MVRRCVFPACASKGSTGISLHRFPKNEAINSRWVHFVSIRRPYYKPSKNDVICDLHFIKSDFEDPFGWKIGAGHSNSGTKLLETAVPTVYPELLGPASKKPCIRGAYKKRQRSRVIEKFLSSEIDKENKIEHKVTELEETEMEQDMLSQKEIKKETKSTQTCCKKGKHSKGSQCFPKSCTISTQCNLLNAPPIQKLSSVAYSFSSQSTSDTVDNKSSVNDSQDLFSTSSEQSSQQDSNKVSDDDKQYLVSHHQLLKLFKKCSCCSTLLSTTNIIKTVIGALIVVEQVCTTCKNTITWESQAFIGRVPVVNFLITSGILFSGSNPTKILRFFKFMNVQSICYRTFLRHQEQYLQPAICRVWTHEQNSLFDVLRSYEEPRILGGDGRSDSPGHSAKFGTYTTMDMALKKIIDIQIVQKNEVGSSNNMELEGLKRSMQRLQLENIGIESIVTDRHIAIAKWISENLTCHHFFDIWHVAKGLNKKIKSAGKLSGCNLIEEWRQSVISHVYWSVVSSPYKNEEQIIAKFTSILNHIHNIHNGNYEYIACSHPPLLEETKKRKKWFLPGNKDSVKLEEILTQKKLLHDIKKLSPTYQTAEIEAFNSVINQFAPKMTAYSYEGMHCRTLLAALHYNENAHRVQAVNRNGVFQHKVTFPRAKSGGFVIRKILEKSTYNYVTDLQDTAASIIASGRKNELRYTCMLYPQGRPPFLSENCIRPDMEMAISQKISRFNN